MFLEKNVLRIIQASILVVFAAFFTANAQPPDDLEDRPGRSPEGRPEIIRQLGLSAEQVQSIRKINEGRRETHRTARERFQRAMRELDAAIYSDHLDESVVRQRLEEFRNAQGELARLRFANELAIRKVLTPEQLVRFRELRRQFAEPRKGDRPLPRDKFRRMRRAPGQFPQT
jgi:Spy/CpxP family protein refolding chaperone